MSAILHIVTFIVTNRYTFCYLSLHIPRGTHRYTCQIVHIVTLSTGYEWLQKLVHASEKNKIWALPGVIFSPTQVYVREIFHKVPVRKAFLFGAKPTGEKFFRFWARRTRERDKGRGHTWPRPRSISPRSYPR